MIRLEITDPTTGTVHVPHLPADSSFEMVRENPMFTRRGDYTYDINISLRDPHNRAIYNHIDRLTATSHPHGRRARLLCDGHVIADGTEVILKKEGDTLKIQILAGASELNHLTADENLMIRDMDFGIVENYTYEYANTVIEKCYPEANYAYPSLNGLRYNEVLGRTQGAVYYHPESILIPCPYLMFYVEKFIRLLGYELEENELLQDERWRRLIIIPHQTGILEYAKILPKWSAAQFVDEIEKFFNCSILIDGINRKARIVSANKPVTTESNIAIPDEDILDEYNTDFKGENKEVFLHNYENVGYKTVPRGEDRLGDYVKENSRTQVLQGPLEGAMLAAGDWVLYDRNGTGQLLVCIYKLTNPSSPSDYQMLYRVDFFADHVSNKEAERTELGIVPAYIPCDLYFEGYEEPTILSPLPKLGDYTPVCFNQAVSGNVSDKVLDTIAVAFYLGPVEARVDPYYTLKLDISTETALAMIEGLRHQFIPVCITHHYYILSGSWRGQELHAFEWDIDDNDVPGCSNWTLSLEGEHGRYATDFSNSTPVNTDLQYVLRFRGKALYDPTCPFLIHGRLFACQQLKYTFKDGRQHPIVEGTFYPYI